MVSLANNQATNKTNKNNSDFNQKRLVLANSLQSSLDLQDTLSSFYKALHNFVSCGGMHYGFENLKLSHMFGNESRHSATYNLRANDTRLGSVTFYRAKKFSTQELEQLEGLIGILIYPLRNALLYREALENSLRDALTQVGNRAALELTLKRELKLSMRSGDPLSLLVIDIDFFKRINDTAGHPFGDKVLRSVANTVKDALRQTDQIFRFGGEEFVVLLSGTPHNAALAIAERIRRYVMAMEIKHHGKAMPISVSIGAASSAENDTRDKLVKRADTALYAAKSNGRNCVVSDREPPTTRADLKTARADLKTG